MRDESNGQTALIATIGERDPDGRQRRANAGVPPEPLDPNDPIVQPTGPLLCAREYRPGVVVLLATAGVRVPAELTRERIVRELGVEPTLRWLAGDHANFDDMQGAVERELRAVRRELPEGARVIVCPSSGTPQMGQALTIVAMFLFPAAQFVQALDPRYLPPDAPRLRPFDPRATRVRFDLERAAQALRDGHWAVAADLFWGVRSFESRLVQEQAAAVTAAWRLARGMGYADELEFTRAVACLEPQRGTGFRAELDALKQWYGGLQSAGRGGPTLPRELAALAARQRYRGALSQAMVMGTLAWETALTVALRTRGKVNPDGLRTADLSRLSPELRARVREEGGRRRLEGARLRRQALAELDAAARQYLDEHGPAVERMVEMRNQLVHTGAHNQSDPDRLIDDALNVLDGLFTRFGWGSWRDAPTAPERLRELATRIAGAWLPAVNG